MFVTDIVIELRKTYVFIFSSGLAWRDHSKGYGVRFSFRAQYVVRPF